MHNRNLSIGSLDLAAGSRNYGALLIAVQNLYRFVSVVKMVTGREMFKPPLPENIFFFRVLRIKEMTLSCASLSFLLTSTSPPDY